MQSAELIRNDFSLVGSPKAVRHLCRKDNPPTTEHRDGAAGRVFTRRWHLPAERPCNVLAVRAAPTVVQTAFGAPRGSIQAYLTATPSRNTPPLFYDFQIQLGAGHFTAQPRILGFHFRDALPRPLRSPAKPTHLPDCVAPSWLPSIAEFRAAWLPHSRLLTALTLLPPS